MYGRSRRNEQASRGAAGAHLLEPGREDDEGVQFDHGVEELIQTRAMKHGVAAPGRLRKDEKWQRGDNIWHDNASEGEKQKQHAGDAPARR